MNKVLVTGATGFIGSNLCRYLLKNNYKVSILSRKNSTYEYLEDIKEHLDIFVYDGSVLELIEFFNDKEFDAVFHFAANHISGHKSENIDALVNSNIVFGLHILEAMKECQTKLMINIGTYAQNYCSDNYNPLNLYAASKQAYIDLIKYYVEAENIRVITLKLFDTYGENDKRKKLITVLNNFSKTGEIIEMTQGDNVISLIHVDDVVVAVMKAYELLYNEQQIKYCEYFVKTEENISLKKVVKIFQEATNKNINVAWGARKYKKREFMNLNNNYQLLPNWESKIPLLEGLRRLK